ncbi:MAG: 2-hydroxyacyl-CoA dehydratase family protein [Promethearchaeia archaeon]
MEQKKILNLENDPFLKLSETIENSYVQQWKQEGKKVLGYYCTYIPEELIHAAGILPYRIRTTGHISDNLADIYMVRFTCGYVRLSLDMALRGGYNFLDGLFVSNSCDHSRRMYEIFDLTVFERDTYTAKPPCFYTAVPHVLTEEGLEWYKREVRNFKNELLDEYNIPEITAKKLTNSIEIYNKNRELLREIHGYRKRKQPKLTGKEFLKITMANSSVPKEIANRELKRILKKLKERLALENNKKRIMLVGSVIDNVDFITLVEKAGASIVSDMLCFGTRNIIDDVKTTSDPLKSIVERTYYRLSCPRFMDDHSRRFDYIIKEIKEGNVEGVILQRINNCDLHGCENMMCEHDLKSLGIPVFNIDREATQSDYTRLRTRIEAFLEMIK